MAPHLYSETDVTDKDKKWWDRNWSFHEVWSDVSGWFINLFQGINKETTEHPYLISLALFAVFAWPHLLCLPFWFSKDGVRHMKDQIRGVAHTIVQPRRRKRDVFVARYRAIVGAGYEPPRPAFGGTPLSDGNLRFEGERGLHIVLRVIRWTCLGLAMFILGREWYRILTK